MAGLARTGFKRTPYKRPPVPSPRRLERPCVQAVISTTAVAIPRQPRLENPHLRDMAKKYGCNLRMTSLCRGSDTSTTVLCHSNWAEHNKGKAMKAHDFYGVYGCAVCHDALDAGYTLDNDEKKRLFKFGLQRQALLYAEIVASKTAKPKDREAARWALEHLQEGGVA